MLMHGIASVPTYTAVMACMPMRVGTIRPSALRLRLDLLFILWLGSCRRNVVCMAFFLPLWALQLLPGTKHQKP